MAMRYYDEAIANKIGTWVTDPDLKVLKPDETSRFFRMKEDQTNDRTLTLPLFCLSRDTNIELDMNIRNSMSFNGYKLNSDKKVLTLDAIPVNLNYQLDIYTRTYEQGDEYLRNLVFGIINNSKLEVYIPFKDKVLKHVAHMRLLPTLSDNSDIPERLWDTEFTRWTLQIEIQDAYFFNVPMHNTWKVDGKDYGTVLLGPKGTGKDEGTIQLEPEGQPLV